MLRGSSQITVTQLTFSLSETPKKEKLLKNVYLSRTDNNAFYCSRFPTLSNAIAALPKLIQDYGEENIREIHIVPLPQHLSFPDFATDEYDKRNPVKT